MIIDFYPDIYPLKQVWDTEIYTCNALATIQSSTSIEIMQKTLFFVGIWFAWKGFPVWLLTGILPMTLRSFKEA